MRTALLLAGLAGCTDLREARQLPASIVADARAAVDANNAFACDLYTALRGDPSPPTNMFLSPFSISTVLSMLDAGAAGATDAQLRHALHATANSDAIGPAYRALLASLATGADDGNYTLQIADRLFGQQGFAFLPTFLAATKTDYGAELMPVDFIGDSSGATNAINTWVSDRTGGTIPTLFGPGDLDDSTRLVAADAIRFQGRWDTKFAPASPGAFHRSDGSTVTAPMMTKPADAIEMTRIPDVGTLVALPFQGKDLSLIALLPDGGLPALEAQLTGDHLAAWLATPRHKPDSGVDVTMPKFGITSSFDLVRALADLGVVDAFDPVRADFSGTDGNLDLSLKRARHEARVSFDEEGAEADVATGTSSVTVVLEPLPIKLDHPFLFLIHDEITGAVLFIGRLGDPSA